MLGTGQRISASGRLSTSPTVCCWPISRRTWCCTAPSTSTSAALSDRSSAGAAVRRSVCVKAGVVVQAADQAASKGSLCWWNRLRTRSCSRLTLTALTCDVATHGELKCIFRRSRSVEWRDYCEVKDLCLKNAGRFFCFDFWFFCFGEDIG